MLPTLWMLRMLCKISAVSISIAENAFRKSPRISRIASDALGPDYFRSAFSAVSSVLQRQVKRKCACARDEHCDRDHDKQKVCRAGKRGVGGERELKVCHLS